MKMIVAIIKPSKLNKVKKLLFENNINRFVVDDCYGHSDQPSTFETYRGVEMEFDLQKKIRIQIAVNDDFVDKTVNAILTAGKSGKDAEGKIFVYPIEQCYSIATGESGEQAIG